MRSSIALVTAGGLLIGLAVVPHDALAASATIRGATSPVAQAGHLVLIDDDDDDGRRVRRGPSRKYCVGDDDDDNRCVRRYVPRRDHYVHPQRSYRKYVPRKRWRGDDDDD